MNHTPDQPLYVFIHITKTGGTSVRAHLQRHLKNHLEYVHVAKKGTRQAEQAGLVPFAARPPEQQLATRVISGHDLTRSQVAQLPHPKKQIIVTFREPKSWLISRYNQRMNRRLKDQQPIIDLPTWLQSQEPFFSQFDWLYAQFFEFGSAYRETPRADRLEYIWQHLSVFSEVMFLHQLDAQMVPYYKQLGIPTTMVKKNITGQDKQDFYQATTTSEAAVAEFVAPDVALYQRILEAHRAA